MPPIYRVNSVSSVEMMQSDHASGSDIEREAQDSEVDRDEPATPEAISCIAPPPSLDVWSGRLDFDHENNFQAELPLVEVVLPSDLRAVFEQDDSGNPIAQADSFYEWLDRMEDTSDFEQAATRPTLVASLKDLVANLRTAGSGLRERCFAMAADALTSCEDRAADALNDMHAIVFDATANLAGKTDIELRGLARRYFALHLVDVHVAHYLEALDPDDEAHKEEVEVRLAFRLALKQQFNLPVQSNGMLYQVYANINTDAKRAACSAVQGGLDDKKGFAAFLAAWPPVRRCVEQRSAGDVQALTEDYLAEGGRLEDAAENGQCTSQEYQEAYDALKAKCAEAGQHLVDKGMQEIIERLVP
jgi:hypothetical protein